MSRFNPPRRLATLWRHWQADHEPGGLSAEIRRRLWLLTALALSVSAISILSISQISPYSVSLTPTSVTMTPLRQVSLPVNRKKNIRLLFNIDQAFIGAEVTLNLPPSVELAGFPNQRRLQWTADIQAGENALVLPLRGLDIATGELQAQIHHQGKSITVRLRIDVRRDPPKDSVPVYDLPMIMV